MSKKKQEQKEEGVVSKSRPAVMGMSSYFIETSSSVASSPITSKSPGMPIASGKPDNRMSVEPSLFDTESTSQVRLKDAYLGGLMEGQRGDPSHQEDKNSEGSDNPAAGTWYYKGEPVAQNNKAWGKPLAHGASCSVDQESQKNTEATWDHYLQKSQDTSHFMEDVFSMVRKIYGKEPGDPVEDLNANLAIWRMFTNTTLRAAVQIGKDYDTNLRFVEKFSVENNGTAFQRNRKAGQWSDRNHWHKPGQFPKMMSFDKLIAQSSSSICHCQGLCLL